MGSFVEYQQAGEHAAPQAETAEDKFSLHDACDEQNFRRDHPQQGDIVPAEFERDRRKDQNGSQNTEKNECRSAAPRGW